MRAARLLATALIIAGLAPGAGIAPAGAQSSGSDELRDLPERLDDALRELMERMKPALEGLADTLGAFEQIDSIEYYEAPEVLPNGDILIRRRDDAPPWPPEEKQDGGDTKETEQGVRT